MYHRGRNGQLIVHVYFVEREFFFLFVAISNINTPVLCSCVQPTIPRNYYHSTVNKDLPGKSLLVGNFLSTEKLVKYFISLTWN